jgi:hypothetical protein
MEILTIIFSKDRAAQLDLLFESISQCDPDMVFEHTTVIYTYSNNAFKSGYQHVIDTYIAEYILESNFKTDILDTIERHKPRHIMFLVDDMMMMKPLGFDIKDAYELLMSQPVATVSLRLGLNTTWQYQIGRPTMMPAAFREHKGMRIWNRTTIPPTMNFNYPFSVDGHIFRSDLIVPIIENTQFTFPNDFEGGLQTSVYQAPPLMACPAKSVFVNAPINRVQDVYPNKAGDSHFISSTELNNRFLDGERINYNKIDFKGVRGCHEELLLPMEKA